MKIWMTTVVLCSSVFTGSAFAQEMNPTAQQPQQMQQPQADLSGAVPVYKVQVVGRDIPAINYFHRSGWTKIGFQGTSLLQQAKGEAKVESKGGRASIEARFEGMVPANSFGQEYLTYVLWAITPDGRPVNLGEVLANGGKATIDATADLQSFGLIVTAEPYYAVTMPSDLVVLQNYVLPDKTQGIIQQINAHATLLPRGAYMQTVGQHAVLNPVKMNDKSPLELYEAINAVQIAQANGAAQYAPEAFQKAQESLTNAEDVGKKGGRREQITYARAAVEGAEDARIITIRKKIEQDREQAQQAKVSAQQEALQAQQAALQAQQAADQQALARAQADAAAAQAQAQAAQAQAQAAAAQQTAQQASEQTAQMRERLKDQLNQVLQTRETARGLIVNMSDVLFDTGQYTLKPGAREKLAKVSGILLAYPNLQLQVEGYTDNVGSDQFNQKLSEERADAVRDYLTSQGVRMGNISATGYGESDPVADNATAQGRAENRRVQLVVSGNSIGLQESTPGNAQSQPPAGPASQSAQSAGVSNPPSQ